MNTPEFPNNQWYYQNKQNKELVEIQIVSNNGISVYPLNDKIQNKSKPVKHFLDYVNVQEMSLEEFHQQYKVYNP
jgi:hypothetical protein